MRLKRILVSWAVAGWLALSAVRPALAFPPLPSSFYGHVTLNGGNAPEGAVVRALINGQPYAETRVQMYEGASVFSLDVRGDDADTPERDGGQEGDVIQFEVGGVLAAETGVWHSGVNVELSLSLAGPDALQTPPATVPPPPTQTPIALEPTPTPSTVTQQPAPVSNSGRLLGIGLGVVALVAFISAGWLALRRKE